MGQCIEGLVSRSHNQIDSSLAGPLADTAHDELLLIHPPLSGIQVFYGKVHLYAAFLEAGLQPFGQVGTHLSKWIVGLDI